MPETDYPIRASSPIMDSFRAIRTPSPTNESQLQAFPSSHTDSAYNDAAAEALLDVEKNNFGGSPGLRTEGHYIDDAVIDSSPDDCGFPRRRTPAWQRILGALGVFVLRTPRKIRRSAKHAPWVDAPKICRERLARRPRVLRGLVYLTLLALMLLFVTNFLRSEAFTNSLRSGILQFVTIVLGALTAFFPDDVDWAVDRWGEPGEPSEAFSHWPTDFTGDINPVACHSHNDYWRKVPLYSAVHAGCIGVEADIWLFDEELYVGHSSMSLTPTRTLENLYINPLLEILEKQNPSTTFHPQIDTPPKGVFDTDPDQTLILLLDFKTAGAALWPRVYEQLEPLREKGYLTYFNGTDIVEGPITVVGTGYAPFDLITGNTTYRDVFFDAPLDEMAESANVWKAPQAAVPDVFVSGTNDEISESDGLATRDASPSRSLRLRRATGQGKSGTGDVETVDEFNPQTSYYASVDFGKTIGHVWRSRLTAQQLDLIRKQIRGAHRRGLKVRYWGVPSWPIGVRNHLWHVLMREGVDILNVDDLVGATRRDWRRRKGWWY